MALLYATWDMFLVERNAGNILTDVYGSQVPGSAFFTYTDNVYDPLRGTITQWKRICYAHI